MGIYIGGQTETAAAQTPHVAATIESVKNDGGDIDIKSSDNTIAITSDDALNEIDLVSNVTYVSTDGSISITSGASSSEFDFEVATPATSTFFNLGTGTNSAVGQGTVAPIASRHNSLAHGDGCTAQGNNSVSIGKDNTIDADAHRSVAFGEANEIQTGSVDCFAHGYSNFMETKCYYSFVSGYNNLVGNGEGAGDYARGVFMHGVANSNESNYSNDYNFIQGYSGSAQGRHQFVQGYDCTGRTNKIASFAQGNDAEAAGYSLAQGGNVSVTADYSFGQGANVTVSSPRSFAQGHGVSATGSSASMVQGRNSYVSGYNTLNQGGYQGCGANFVFIQGKNNICTGHYSLVQGGANATNRNKNYANRGLLQGQRNENRGTDSLLQGFKNVTVAAADYSFLQGADNASSSPRTFTQGISGTIGTGAEDSFNQGSENTIDNNAARSFVQGRKAQAKFADAKVWGSNRNDLGKAQSGHTTKYLQTTDDTADQVIAAIPSTSAQAFLFEVALVGRGPTGGNVVWTDRIEVQAYRDGGDITINGAPAFTHSRVGLTTAAADINANTGTQEIEVRVTGEAATVIDWVAMVDIIECQT